jgi:hypothetical protein
MHVCLTIKYYKIMGGDKIVLLDGAGANGGGAATNGLLSMIPGMFANLIGGNKMDPNPGIFLLSQVSIRRCRPAWWI